MSERQSTLRKRGAPKPVDVPEQDEPMRPSNLRSRRGSSTLRVRKGSGKEKLVKPPVIGER